MIHFLFYFTEGRTKRVLNGDKNIEMVLLSSCEKAQLAQIYVQSNR